MGKARKVRVNNNPPPVRYVQTHRSTPAPPPVQSPGYARDNVRYTPPAQMRYDVADILNDPLTAVAVAQLGPRPSPGYGSSTRFRPLADTERALRDAATQYGRKGQTALSAVARGAYKVVRALDDVAGPVTGVAAGVAVASLGGIIPMESGSVDSEPEKVVDKVAKEVPDKIVKEPENEKPVKPEVQEYKAPEKQEPVKTVAKGRGRAGTEFFAGAGQVASYVSAVEGGNTDGSFDPSDRAQVQQVGPLAQYLSGVASAFRESDPQNGIFVQHWFSMQGQMKNNVTSPGQGCLPVEPGAVRYDGAQIALQDIAALKALAGKAGLDINNIPAQKPGSYVGGFGWEVAKIIKQNEAAVQKALNQQCTVDKSEAALGPESVQAGVDTLGRLAQVFDGFKQWVDREPNGLGPVSPWVAGIDNLGRVYTGGLERASAQALADGVRLAQQYNDAALGIDEASPAFAGLVPFNNPPTIEGLVLDSAVPAYLGFEPVLTGLMKDSDGKGIRTGQVQIGDEISELPVSGKATEKIEYTLKNLPLGNNKVLVRAGDGAWVVDTSLDVEVTDPAPIMDTWSSSVEKVSDGLYKVYVSAFLADDNNNIESARAVDVNGSGFNVNMEKTAETKIENGKTFVRYEGSMNVRLKNPGDSRDLSLQLRYKDPTNPEVQAPNIEKIRVVYPKPEPPNPGNNGTPTNNSTVIPPIDNGNGQEPQKDYRSWLAGLVALAGGGGTAIWQRTRIAAALSGLGRRGNGARYAPLAGGVPRDVTDSIEAIFYVHRDGRIITQGTTKTARSMLQHSMVGMDPDIAAGMTSAVLSGLSQALGTDVEEASLKLTGGKKAIYRRGERGTLAVVTGQIGDLEIEELTRRMVGGVADIDTFVEELTTWAGEIDPNTPVPTKVRDILQARIIEGKDYIPPIPAGVPILNGTQGEAERPAGAGEIQMKPPEHVLPKAVKPAEGFEPPSHRRRIFGGGPVAGESHAPLEPTPTPTFVMPPGPDVPAPQPPSSDALRRSIMDGIRVPPDAAPGVGMHPGVPANGVTANGNGNGGGEPVDSVDSILARLGEKGKGGAGR